MFPIQLFFASLLLVSTSFAAPAPEILPRQQGSSGITVTTPLGQARGSAPTPNVVRFVVRYATANRWQPSTVATQWQLPNGATDPNVLPLACPQDASVENSAATSEDCLSLILYVPAITVVTKFPTLVWVHGGSFVVGSATGPGLDGSKLATATGSIVAVVQYRLGALGFMPPSGDTNLAVKDVINSLRFLQKVLPSFNGDTSKVTLAGQSSGATMIRTLLASSSAASLFRNAILQSDVMNVGFLSTTTQTTLQNSFISSLNCTATDSACLKALSVDSILSAQDKLIDNAAGLDPAAGTIEPIRPVRDGMLVTATLDSTSPFPRVSKPVLISTVVNEAGSAIYSGIPYALPESAFSAAVNSTFGAPRTNTIVNSPHYALPAGANFATFDARVQLQTLGTDYLWKCSAWTFARNWVQSGGRAFVGMYVVGATYPSNAGISFCTQPGSVCHEDDIQIVFGTVQNATSAQSALTKEMQARYKAFLYNNAPNPSGMTAWTPATTTDVHARQLGGTGEAPVGACDPAFWGKAVEYDYQFYSE